MYVTSVSGLRIYDISDPAAPAEVGALALPHFENEDVDLGGDILLISNDAAESTGILYVIDISDPTAPAIASTFPMGGDPVEGGPGHTASCIKNCQFAWVTDTGGIRVIDLRDPTAPVEPRHDRRAPRMAKQPHTTSRSTATGSLGWSASAARSPTSSPRPTRARVSARSSRRRTSGAEHVLRRARDRRRLEPERLHPPQLPPEQELERPLHHRRGLQPAGLPGRGFVRDLAGADQQEGHAQREAGHAARSLGDGAERSGSSVSGSDVLGSLLRRARQRCRSGLVRAGHPLPRRQQAEERATDRLPTRRPTR